MSSSQPLVLVVDDDADTRELYRIVLESVGYRVEDAATLRQTTDVLRRIVPDVIMTDWLLPDGNGLDVCRAVRGHTELRAVPLIAVSGLRFSDEVDAEARALGVGAVLEKPLEPNAMLRAIRDALLLATGGRLRKAACRTRRYARCLQRAARQEREGSHAREQALALLERAAARSGGSVVLVIADDEAQYVAAGGATRELTGYAPQELSALTVWDLTPLAQGADGRGLWHEFIARGTQEGEYVLRRRDGASVTARYCALANIAPGWHVSALAPVPQMPVTLG